MRDRIKTYLCIVALIVLGLCGCAPGRHGGGASRGGYDGRREYPRNDYEIWRAKHLVGRPTR